MGDWRIVDCTAKNNDEVAAKLWNDENEKHIDGERRKQISRNKFKIMNPKVGDLGKKFLCKACGEWKNPVTIKVTITWKGKPPIFASY